MKIFQVLFAFLFLYFYSSVTQIYASDFTTDAQVTYDILTDGKTTVRYTIAIENTSESSFSKGYVLSLTNLEPYDIAAKEDGKEISPELMGSDHGTAIQVNFQKPSIGIKKQKHIEITFTSDHLAKKSGGIWEVYIPKLVNADSFTSYDVTLRVPYEFGNEVYMYPNIKTVNGEDGKKVYSFKKDSVESGVNAAFGKSQVYSYTLKYHLKNDSWKSETQTIALPPDTSTQKIYLEHIEPKPMSVFIDKDGNWIASYTLSSFKQLEITVLGKAQLLGGPRKLINQKEEELNHDIQPTKYWPSDNSKIQELAKELKTPASNAATPSSNSASASSNTAKAIYDYVTKTLRYDYKRTNAEAERLGGVKALDHPDSAICMEFTDLFITIARAAGIPAREINGYAQSENPKIQPLSLVADILHSWPEYWDADKELWIPVDPTWGNTTGGQDYFSGFDMRHIAFVVHGENDSTPLPPGSYKSDKDPQKDVFVELSSLSGKEENTANISYIKEWSFPFSDKVWNISVSNNGDTAMYDQYIHVYEGAIPIKEEHIPILPPFGIYTFTYKSAVGLFANKEPSVIRVKTAGASIALPVSPIKTIGMQILFIVGMIIFLTGLVLLFKYRKKVVQYMREISFR